MADIFLSYSSADRERIRPLVSILEQQGWSVWWDRKIPPGKTYDQVIEQALDAARCVVVVWSQTSVQSEWVKVEADEGMNRKILVPVLIEDARPPLAFRRIQAARLVDWRGESSHHELAMLFESIAAIIGQAAAVEEPAPEELPVPIQTAPAKEKKPPAQPPPIVSPKPPVVSPTFEFEVVTVDAKGNVTARTKKSASYIVEDLGDGVKLEMVEIPGGAFTMGSPENEAGRYDLEGPQHRVTVKPFFMGKYQITREQWRAIASDVSLKVERDLEPDPSFFKDDWRQPVELVSWEDAVEFCKRLEKKTGKLYRLPSEAEWEYAARAGATTPFSFGPTITPEIVNYDGNRPYGSASKGKYRGKTVPVGSLGVANAFGLFDMHGNVWEWCEDDWHDSYANAPSDGSAWVDNPRGSDRVDRGGGWNDSAVDCRSANRDGDAPGYRSNDLGFRLLRTYR